MRCTKCHYLSFEPEPRCKNCGHDLSLEEDSTFSDELEVVGARTSSSYATAAVMRAPKTAPAANSGRIPTKDLPLFVQSMQSVSDQLAYGDDGHDDAPVEVQEELEPLVKVPARPRTPVSVRRPTPDPARLRAKCGMSSSAEPDLWSNLPPDPIDQVPLHDEPEVFEDLPLTSTPEEWVEAPKPVWSDEPATDGVPLGWQEPVSAGARLFAALIDVLFLGGISLAVIYLTLQVSGLSMSQIGLLPILPLGTLLAMMVGGYFLLFKMASGKTLGNMAMGL